jgi:DNA-binding transcriptional MerR regulator
MLRKPAFPDGFGPACTHTSTSGETPRGFAWTAGTNMGTTAKPPASSSSEGASRLTISELARLARTTRDTLLFYDRIGLLVPESRGANHYRYYSERELLKINFIRTFKSLGMSLKEIRKLLENRTPESVLMSLREQMAVIRERQIQLRQTYLLLENLQGTIEYALDLDENVITTQWCDEKPIIIAPKNDYSHGRMLWDNILDSYQFFQELVTPLEMNYPVWSIYEKESVKNRRWGFPDRFYMNNPSARCRAKSAPPPATPFPTKTAPTAPVPTMSAPAKAALSAPPPAVRGGKANSIFALRSAGWYVTGCTRGRYGDSAPLFERLLTFIEAEGLTMVGRSYVDYLLNEISIQDSSEYLIQIAIAVASPSS